MWVLQIDDDQDDLDIFGAALNLLDPGIKYNGVEKLEDALALLDKYPITVPDVVFLDINMPRYSGFDCHTLFQKDSRFKHCRFVFLSTTINLKDIPAGCDFLEKQHSLKTYGSMLKRLLRPPLNSDCHEKVSFDP
jgi:DNA-binding NtrC family response regulator